MDIARNEITFTKLQQTSVNLHKETVHVYICCWWWCRWRRSRGRRICRAIRWWWSCWWWMTWRWTWSGLVYFNLAHTCSWPSCLFTI